MLFRIAAAIAVVGFLAINAQAADRPPTNEERIQIENALKAHGFTSWGKIELDDDGYWEIDNAVAADGKRYDVDLGKSDFKILKQKLD